MFDEPSDLEVEEFTEDKNFDPEFLLLANEKT
jgi:hypothetical protein